ncbi:unnamed protein product [Musa acuminata subsp. burmannicoides]
MTESGRMGAVKTMVGVVLRFRSGMGMRTGLSFYCKRAAALRGVRFFLSWECVRETRG